MWVTVITTKKYLKYLGVMIDNRLAFKHHLEYIRNKSSKTCASLSGIMPNTRGPKYLRRKVIMEVKSLNVLYSMMLLYGQIV